MQITKIRSNNNRSNTCDNRVFVYTKSTIAMMVDIYIFGRNIDTNK